MIETLEDLRALVTTQAVCDIDVIDKIYSENARIQAQVKREYCNRCPVEKECLALAVWQKEEKGVWGGLSARERRKYMKTLDARKLTINRLLGIKLESVPSQLELHPPHLMKIA